MKKKYLILIILGVVIPISIVSIYWMSILTYSDINECWYEDDDGNMLPCRIQTGPILWEPTPPNCDEMCPDDNKTKTVMVEGELAQKICDIINEKEDCPASYPGNIQEDGSVMVGFVISGMGQEEPKHYQFLIDNDKLIQILSPGSEKQENIIDKVSLTLYVSNQSFLHNSIDITITLGGNTIISDTFDVEGQHSFHPFYYDVNIGKHTIHVESGNETLLTQEFEIDKEMWAVITYWYYEEDDKPFFIFETFDEPVGFL